MMADLPGGKKERCSGEETDLLVHEVKAHKQTIYGTSRNPPKIPKVKQAWQNVAASVSSVITRTATQCCKPYNNVRR